MESTSVFSTEYMLPVKSTLTSSFSTSSPANFSPRLKKGDIRKKNSVDRHLFKNFEISKMSPPKRYSSSRVWFISSLTMLAASMLLFSI